MPVRLGVLVISLAVFLGVGTTVAKADDSASEQWLINNWYANYANSDWRVTAENTIADMSFAGRWSLAGSIEQRLSQRIRYGSNEIKSGPTASVLISTEAGATALLGWLDIGYEYYQGNSTGFGGGGGGGAFEGSGGSGGSGGSDSGGSGGSGGSGSGGSGGSGGSSASGDLTLYVPAYLGWSNTASEGGVTYANSGSDASHIYRTRYRVELSDSAAANFRAYAQEYAYAVIAWDRSGGWSAMDKLSIYFTDGPIETNTAKAYRGAKLYSYASKYVLPANIKYVLLVSSQSIVNLALEEPVISFTTLGTPSLYENSGGISVSGSCAMGVYSTGASGNFELDPRSYPGDDGGEGTGGGGTYINNTSNTTNNTTINNVTYEGDQIASMDVDLESVTVRLDEANRHLSSLGKDLNSWAREIDASIDALDGQLVGLRADVVAAVNWLDEDLWRMNARIAGWLAVLSDQLDRLLAKDFGSSASGDVDLSGVTDRLDQIISKLDWMAWNWPSGDGGEGGGYENPFSRIEFPSVDGSGLMEAGRKLGRVFPFSLPADVIGMLGALAVEPVTPAFEWAIPNPVDPSSPFVAEVDLSPLDDVMAVVRTGELLLVGVGLLFVSSKVTGGF